MVWGSSARLLIEEFDFAAWNACSALSSSDGRGVAHLAKAVAARPKKKTMRRYIVALERRL